MRFKCKTKSVIKAFLVICPSLLITFQLYAIIVRHNRPDLDDLSAPLDSEAEDLVLPLRLKDGGTKPQVNLVGEEEGKWKVDTFIPPWRFAQNAEKLGREKGRQRDAFDAISDKTADLKFVVVANASIPKFKQPFRQTELGDIFISVKTSGKFHKDRVGIILKTWHGLAKEQTFFFTDTDDAEYTRQTNNHFVNTNCSAIHSRDGLCCKMSIEYEFFLKRAMKYRWFCHVDDDTYLNVPALVHLLQPYDHVQDWYIGKPSLNHQLVIPVLFTEGEKLSFWFATGGAGFCLSRGLALKMRPYTSDGKFQAACNQIRLPDDCTLGFIIHQYLNTELTQIQEFHSHLEALRRIKLPTLAQQITFSYSDTTFGRNILQIDGFSEKDDPTRFMSIHCYLFPNTSYCEALKDQHL